MIDETLRCSVLAPFGARTTPEDREEGILIGGHRVPPSTPVVCALGVALQDEKVFPDPERLKKK